MATRAFKNGGSVSGSISITATCVGATPAPTVTSLSPTFGPTAGGSSVVITGTDFTGATAVTFAGNAATSFTVNSATQITATAPAGTAGQATVSVTTSAGTGTLTNGYTYVAAPTVTSVSPTAGSTTGGTTVTITGSGFLTAAPTGAVKFGAANATYTVNSNTQITATSPANAAGTYDITVTNPGGTSATSAADQFTYLAAPTVTAVSPTAGPVSGGTAVVITGTGFAAASPTGAVKFGATNATYTINSNTQITATSAANAAGTYDITVTTAGGTSATSAADQFTYLAAPTIVTVAPSSGPQSGGTAVQIVGNNLSAATAVTFGATAATSFVVNDPNRITATAPAGTGTVDIRVTTPAGTSVTSSNDQFTYLPPPTVTAISPSAGPASGGTTVTITGTGFGGVNAVSFGATPATGVVFSSATQITATAPAGTGTVDVRVTTQGGTSATSAADQFTYIAAPAVTSVTPNSGPSAGGTNVTITGSNFSGATGVTIGGTSATNVTVVSASQITATTPSHAAGAVAVAVTTAGGTGTLAGGFTYVAAPTASSFTYGSIVGYNAGGNQPTLIDVSFSATGNPTSYAVGSTTTAQGGSVSIDNAGQASYRPPAGFRGNDSFTYTATNGGGASAPATVTVAVGNPTFLINLVGSGTRGAVLSGVAVNVTDGHAPYSCGTTPASGALPAGTQLNADCTITGTPTASGTFSFTARVTDSSTGIGPYTATSGTLTLVVAAPTLMLSPGAGALPTASVGAAYSQNLTASGGTAPYTFAITAGALPPGLTLSAGGAISGTPVAAGTFNFNARATDSASAGSGGPYSVTNSYSLTIAAPTIVVTPTTVPGGTVGAPYSQSLSASGGNAPYTFAVTAGALPAGMTLASSGTLAGTPTAGGTYNFTVSATDSSAGPGAPYAGSRAYSFTVAAPTIVVSPATLPAASVGTAYSQTISASGGTPGYSFAVTAGALPAGLTLSSSGVLSGTATAGGTFNFAVTATDNSTGAGAPYSGSRGYTLTVAAPTVVVVPATLPNGTAGATYAATITASGGVGSHTYAVTAGALPAGLTLSSSGSLSGTPTAGGTFNFTITATDSSGGSGPYSGSRAYSLAIAAPTVTLTPTTLPSGSAGTSYSQTVTASGGVGPYTYAVTAGALPVGLSLTSSGTLAGTPTAGGTFNFTVTATDSSVGSGPYSGSRAYSVTVAAPTITLAPTTLPNGTAGTSYSQTVTASGGVGSYTYAVTAGALPAGLTLSTAGTLAGTPTAGGTFNFTMTATDSSTGAGPYSGSRAYSLVIAAPTVTISPTTLPNGTAGASYSQAITASGGVGSYRYAVTAGALPAGLSLSSSGTLAGTPTAGGTFNFTVTATDSGTGAGPYSGSRSYALTIAAPVITIAPATLPSGTPGTAYSQTLTASGGTGTYGFAVTAGALPAGLTLSSTGTLSGTPTTGGSFNFTVTATDGSTGSGPYSGSRAYTLNIGAATITVTTATLPNATVAGAYSQAIAASGGTAPYTYAVTAGALPAGLSLSSTGTLAGTPTAGGSFTFTVTATDSSGGTGPFSGNRTYTLVVGAPTIALAPTTLANATRNVAYSQSLTASGGVAPYNYAVTSGALPAGLTLAANGTLSGTATAAGTYNFTVRATDSATGAGPYSGTQAYSLNVTAPTIVVAPATLAAGAVASAYSGAITASGGVAPYTFAATAGALPPGIMLSASGALSGTPASAGSFNFVATANDVNGNTGTQSYALTIAKGAQTITFANPGARSLSASPVTVTATSVSGLPVTFSSSTTAICTVSGNSVTLLRTGTCTIAADQVGDANYNPAQTVSQSFAVTPAILVATQAQPSISGTVGTLLSATPVTASGGTTPYSFALTGTLPAGLTFSTTTGTLSGTPTGGQAATGYTVTVSDAGGQTATSGFILTVAAPTLTVAPANLPAGTAGTAYSQVLTTSGGTAPYSYAVTAGALPAGLMLSSTGTLSGSSTQSGSFTFTVTATDSSSGTGPYTATRSYTLAIAAPALSLSPAALADAAVGATYSQTLTTSGGTAPYGYAVTSGALPAGVALSSGGVLSGTPSAGGTFTFTVTATDATTPANGGPYAANRAYTLRVAAPTIAVAPTTVPAATKNVAYSQTLTALGGVAPYSYAVTGGALPAGLTLAANGTLAGSPTVAGTFNFTVTATDSSTGTGPYAGTQAYSLVVSAPTIAVTPATLTGGTVATAYSATLSATGGTAPYAFTVAAGALPGGLTLASGGTLSGTPTAAGSFGFTVTATDANGNAGTQAYTLAIAKAAQAISFANPGSRSLSVSPVTLTATSNSGLAVSLTSSTTSVCTVSGNAVTLLQTGTCTIAANQGGNANYDPAPTVTQSFAVTPANLVVTQAQASVSGSVGIALSATPVTATGGTTPYGFALTGTLPAGLNFSTSTGTLSGTPTGGQAATGYTVTVSDAGGQTASSSFTLTVAAPTVAITPTSLPAGNYQTAYSQQLSAAGGVAPYRFAVTAGVLPAGLTLSQAGLLSGTPTAGGSFAFTVTATDASTGTGPYSASQNYTLAVALPAPPVAQSPGQPTTTTSTTAAGQPVVIDLSVLVSGIYDTIEIGTRPQHGTVSLAQRTQGLSRSGTRYLAEYVPNAGYAGTDSFGFVAVGPGGRSSEATIAIAVVGSVPVAPAVRGTTISAQPVVVDLTAGAVNGPFTAARIVSVSPSDAVTAELIEGGTAGNRTYQLRLTPGGRFSGTATVQYTLSNAFGTSAPAVVTLTVAARPDPAQDATVRGLSAAQAESARRFASAQTGNFMRRTEQLHGDGAASQTGQMGVRLNLPLPNVAGQWAPDPAGTRSDEAFAASGYAREVAGREMVGRSSNAPGALQAGSTLARAGGTGGNTPAPQGPAVAADDGTPGQIGRPVGSTSLWSGGAIEVGVRDATTRRAKLSLSSSGLSAGIDMKLADWITVGVGGGYGSDRTKVGGNAGRVDGENVVGVGYASLQPARGLFIDGVFGGGSLSFDTRRAVAANAAIAIGHRKGSMLFGSLAAGFDRSSETFQLSAYGRIDWLDAKLRAYRENGAGIYDLAFAKRDLSSLAGVIGLRGALPMGAWTPRLRFEYRHDFSASGGQSLDYAGLTGFGYRIDGDGWLRDAFNAEIGAEVRAGIWRFGFDLGGQLGQNSRAVTLKGTIGAQF